MTLKVSGALATAMTLALTGAVSAQSTTNYYQQIQNGYQAGPIASTATTTFQATTQPAPGTSVYAPANNYAIQQQPTTYAPQQIGTVYAAPTVSTQAPAAYSATTPSYASPYTPTAQPTVTALPTVNAPQQTYVATPFGNANAGAYQQPTAQTYQQPVYSGTITSQPLPAPTPASAYTSSVPASTAPSAGGIELQDTDTWAFNLARYYPAIQACLRKSSAKNPVIANIQVRDSKTMMLIGEGGSSSFSTCSTGLTGTVVKADSDIRTLPPAFFAPLGSTFTVSPDRPFQPIVDTDQKVIGWLVRTQPSRGVNQFGQSVGFDGQFIPPVMVNTSVGKS